MAKKPVRLAVVISHPIQYWVPVYRHLAADPSIELKVFYVGENGASGYFDSQFNRHVQWDIPLTDGYEYEFLRPGHILENYRFGSVDSKNVGARLAEFAPDYIWVNGYAHKVIWRSIWAERKRAKFIVNSDSNLTDSRRFSRRVLKRWLVQFFYKQIHAAISCSPSNLRYLQHYGVPEQRIVNSVMPVDIQRLQQQVDQLIHSDIKTLKRELGIAEGERVLLFAGKLIDHKRPQDVLKLTQGLRERGHLNVHALVVGSGVLDAKLKAMTAELNLEAKTHFVGFVNQSEMAKYFAISDLLIFPSEREPYGVIATEVLPFGLPILAADNIGSVGAAILDGQNALLYPCGNIHAMTEQADKLLSDDALYERVSACSRKMAPQHDASVLAKDLIRICTEPLPITRHRDSINGGAHA